jgi:hypothetical protein|tara:strand:+ start:458 stop:667 length:210 start_codon:yes stop_codon:yes gene_type:complete
VIGDMNGKIGYHIHTKGIHSLILNTLKIKMSYLLRMVMDGGAMMEKDGKCIMKLPWNITKEKERREKNE